MAVPSTIKQRARKAAWISFFIGGFGGMYYTGHWILGTFYMGLMVWAFFMIFLGFGIILFPAFWLFGTMATYMMVRRDAVEMAILSQAEQAERRGQILGGTA